MKDRFDLEEEMLNCWGITTELKELAEAVCEESLTNDKIANILIGLDDLYTLKFEKMFNTFSKLVQQGFPKERYEL